MSFKLKLGRYIIHGPNGCGKSTLLRILAGADDQWSGTIKLSEVDQKKQYFQYTKCVSYVPDSLTFFNQLYVSEFIPFALAQRPRRTQSKLESLADSLGFDIDSMKSLGDLSLGNAKKLMLLIALCSDCDLYIFDEPLNGLDNQSCDVFIKELSELTNKLVIISTHVQHSAFDSSFSLLPFYKLNEYG
ncbi:ATP-binding cassette domain-containing protein [Pleionea mediterranea]|uniref:ATP-binding cassette domain-containing protein n=1 Tax=Pleionea mediterranea TaxID=523701 RepID=UPI00147606D7|nr:ATP-binding cassette domain-containing protein [Pleionea mediterranea]